LVHHLFEFFKSNLTVPKIKDLVNVPTQKYENMYNIINNNNNNDVMLSNNDIQFNNNNNIRNNNNKSYSLIDLLPKNDEDNMKSELKNFLKSQLNNSNTNDNELAFGLEADSQSYSNY